MTWAFICGGLVGIGVFLLVRMLVRPAPNVLSTIARIDAGRAGYSSGSTASAAGEKVLGGVDKARETLGRRLEAEANARGWAFGRLRRDLAVMNQPFAAMLATKMFFALGALIFIPVVLFAASYLGFPAPGAAPAVVTLAAMVFAFFLPDLALRQEAEERRRDFRHVVGSFLDLVAMNLAGGRGLPEALMTASTIGDHWAMARIRQALANARLIGITPWDAMARLGEDLGVEELRDLASALALAGDEGAKIRASLLSRAASLRRKELADVEGKAGERSQSMLVAQLVMCAAFMLFLGYPAGAAILGS
ncbi:type II secretion system F family protein [Kribbella italica]|uniref:Flp pilus assembly protein TadB n=1 Tax=Kribbella italica TaxID=1540520 RepID=A0A7W9MSU8_9ACTN|nr:type II secretion system F family protein [Kribbella italica]MBB5835081.1 Flp pilus assembly protein TadB [Kribbella italica]